MNETRGLWRGKHDDVDSSEWLVGYLIKMWEKICLQDPKCENNVAEVDPSTLGECTDLTDKNGNKIFEGDIVKAKWRYLSNTDTVIGVVKYDNADFILGQHRITSKKLMHCPKFENKAASPLKFAHEAT